MPPENVAQNEGGREAVAQKERDARMLADLSRIEAYPAPRPTSVVGETTHASWVFLTDAHAYKLKRPVNLGFLDYGTAALREAACHDEVRLGRRLAPDVYLGVVPVYLGAEGHSFVGPGQVVDHAVQMRRLPREQSAVELLRAGRLDAEALGRLADQLAAFFAAAPPHPEFGGPGQLRESMQENWRQTLPFAGTIVDRAALEALHDWQVRTLTLQAPRIEERRRAGRIREGHGDLRLEHVYFPVGSAGPAIVIDPIEFNASFRCVDQAMETAFLAMELDAAGRADLGAWFLSRFARATNDYGCYPLLDLYLSHLAWVRAKVACFVAADPSTPVDKVRRKRDEASRLLALASSYTRPSRAAPVVIAVGGLIGAGKSTVAESVGFALRLPVISSDRTRKHLAGLSPLDRGDAVLYSGLHTQRTYDEVLARAKDVLASGRGVVLDATFRSPSYRVGARALANAHGIRFLFVEVTCDDATLDRRLRARVDGGAVSDAREGLLPWMREHFQSPTELAAEERLTVDGGGPVEAAVEAVRARLPTTRA